MSEQAPFASPYLLTLLVLPFITLLYELKTLSALKLPLSSHAVFAGIPPSLKTKLAFLPPVLRAAGLVLLIIALARPQSSERHVQQLSEGVDIVMAIDTSRSMLALDMEQNGRRTDRMTVVKSVVTDFIKGREHDRIGMVVFGEHAYTQCPLTIDYDILTGYIDLIDVGIAGDATAIGNALATGVKRLATSTAKSRVIILVTDGKNTAGDVSPLVAANLAREKSIKVYTIAVGSDAELVPMPVETFFGKRVQNVRLEMDEKLLQEIAATTGGKYFRADTTDTLESVYREINDLEKTKVEIKEFTEYQEQFVKYLIPAFVLIVTGWLLRHTVFLRAP